MSRQKVCFLLQKSPDSVKEKDSHSGNLPLHDACKAFHADLSVVKILFKAYPEAIHTRNDDGLLPLHCACSGWGRGSAMKIIRFLAAQLPYSVSAVDAEGRIPLHHACNKFRLEVLKQVVQLYPKGLRVESPQHGLPIHCACQESSEMDVIQYLESLYPASLAFRNEKWVYHWNVQEVENYLYIFCGNDTVERNLSCTQFLTTTISRIGIHL